MEVKGVPQNNLNKKRVVTSGVKRALNKVTRPVVPLNTLLKATVETSRRPLKGYFLEAGQAPLNPLLSTSERFWA